MVRILLLAVALLVSGVAVVAATPSSFDVESAYHRSSQPASPELQLAATK